MPSAETGAEHAIGFINAFQPVLEPAVAAVRIRVKAFGKLLIPKLDFPQVIGRFDLQYAERTALVLRDGFGNPCNNGVRNYAKVDGELYLGTTSWCNLGEDSGLEYYRYEEDEQ